MNTPFIVATDGSALGNPGPTGWAWFIDEQNWMAGGLSHATNNIGELLAIKYAIKMAGSLSRPLIIESDSRYAISSVTEWGNKWKLKEWKTSSGSQVANREIIEEIMILISNYEVHFNWIKGHSGHYRNEKADVHAREAALHVKNGYTDILGPGYNY